MLHSVTVSSSTASLASVKILMKFMDIYIYIYIYIFDGESFLFGLNGIRVIVLLVVAIDDACEMKRTADWTK